MKKNILNEKLFWVLLIALVVGAILFKLFRNSFSSFDNVISLLNTMAACLTFGISYLLFDKYGIKKSVLEKQFEATIEIIHELKKIRILYEVEYVDKGVKLTIEFGQIFIQRDMTIYRSKPSETDVDKGGFQILVNVQDLFNGTANLSKALSNIWLPHEIKQKFNFLSFLKFTKPPDLDDRNTICIAFASGILKANPELDFYLPDDGTLTFKDLINHLEEGLNECQDWINKHAEHDFDLNI